MGKVIQLPPRIPKKKCLVLDGSVRIPLLTKEKGRIAILVDSIVSIQCRNAGTAHKPITVMTIESLTESGEPEVLHVLEGPRKLANRINELAGIVTKADSE